MPERNHQIEDTLRELLILLNRDKDGDYFLCKEAEPLIQRAYDLLEMPHAPG